MESSLFPLREVPLADMGANVYIVLCFKNMIVITDHQEYADSILPGHGNWTTVNPVTINPNLYELMRKFYGTKDLYQRPGISQGRWGHALIVRTAPSSHFDQLIRLAQKNVRLPDGIICQAGSSEKLHGQRNRPWAALDGNIHLSVYLAPGKRIRGYHVGFPVLAAVSLIDTLDAVHGLEGRARIKWVNDVLIDGAKVAGFLVHTLSSMDTVIAAILGIGLNVEKTPRVKPDPFAPKVGSLREFVQDPPIIDCKNVLTHLLDCLDKNYSLLLDGRYLELLDSYKARSLVIGQEVKIISDTPGQKPAEIAAGIVEDIGENLELYIRGEKQPVTKGRLILAHYT
jgi:biotin-[acetyl-CoA-carboxylase] ligase BirA-like protein